MTAEAASEHPTSPQTATAATASTCSTPTQAQVLAAAKVLHDEDSLMDPKPHSYERLSLPARIAYEDVAIRVLGAALRAAGGQEEPRAGNGVFGPDGEPQPTDYRAPVGGQA